jgi:hypothetical protein
MGFARVEPTDNTHGTRLSADFLSMDFTHGLTVPLTGLICLFSVLRPGHQNDQMENFGGVSFDLFYRFAIFLNFRNCNFKVGLI